METIVKRRRPNLKLSLYTCIEQLKIGAQPMKETNVHMRERQVNREEYNSELISRPSEILTAFPVKKWLYFMTTIVPI